MERIAFTDLPARAVPIARALGLDEASWDEVLRKQQVVLAQRVEEGSAEHVTYFVLQSGSFTSRPPIDPVRLAASRPKSLPDAVLLRILDFRNAPVRGERHRIVRELFRSIEPRWSLEACFVHTMAFLAERAAREGQPAAIDEMYRQRGLSADTSRAQTLVLKRAERELPALPSGGRILLVGPGLDLTRRQGFTDDLPLSSHQADWLRAKYNDRVECMDVRPEVVAFTGAVRGDVTQDVPGRAVFDRAYATNLFVYFSDLLLFLAMASLAVALKTGGHLVHNDNRFAVKVFGESLDLPVRKFESFGLGEGKPAVPTDWLAMHERTVAAGKGE